jgi:membrane protease YdiL (CAAX protease family)
VISIILHFHDYHPLGDFNVWVFLVIIPFIILLAVQRSGVLNLFRSVGFQRTRLKHIFVTVCSWIIFLPFTYYSSDTLDEKIFISMVETPVKFIIAFVISFCFSIMLFGFTEELFFRGMLQSRMAIVLNSNIRALLVTSFLFGIYHFPNLYFNPNTQTHGNLGWSIASFVTEQMFAGILLGILWMRYKNLYLNILLHGLIDTLFVMAMIKFE